MAATKPPPNRLTKIIIKIAGIEAIAHLTMNITIDQNGTLTSTITTSCRSGKPTDSVLDVLPDLMASDSSSPLGDIGMVELSLLSFFFEEPLRK
jgi:hypothetical protein